MAESPLIVSTEMRHCAQLTVMINEIIQIGGTTAYQRTMTNKEFCEEFIERKGKISCHCALSADGIPIGFQFLKIFQNPQEKWGDISTFVQAGLTGTGIGSALFEATLGSARAVNLVAINALIRSDNAGGQRYYEKLGFDQYLIKKAVPLVDGTPVDRIYRRYLV